MAGPSSPRQRRGCGFLSEGNALTSVNDAGGLSAATDRSGSEHPWKQLSKSIHPSWDSSVLQQGRP